MFRIAVCDDEKPFREQMKEILQEYMREHGVYYKIDTFQSGEELLDLGIELNQYRVIFLDINMEEMDGLATARRIREHNIDIFIVFVTAFVHYSVEGYQVNAIRFLLKGTKNLQGYVAECMDAIYQKMQYEVDWREFDFIDGRKKVSLNRILYVESSLHKLNFHVMEDKMVSYILYDTLNHLEKYIESKYFLRCHQSFLVNMKYIKSLRHYEVILYDGMSLPIPKARYRDVHDTYVAYKGEI